MSPFDAVMLFVNNHTLVWARQGVRVLRQLGLPSLVMTQRLGGTAIGQLLGAGARDFLSCECSQDEFALRLSRLRDDRGLPASAAAPAAALHPLLARCVGTSAAFLRQVERVPTLAGCDATVLIEGETGTGKELLAQAIHYLSPRASHPWVAVNCGALPADLVEAELFGHARGAYTGALDARKGLVAEAEGGTLFLDEVDSLPHASQAKLLRFLQEKEYRRLGAPGVVRANVRIIAASNADLEASVAEGRFRKDLYYRLNVLTLRLPALRERMEDIGPLARHFIAHYATQHGRALPHCGAQAMERMDAYGWPGNVRELEHAIERAVLLCVGGCIEAGDLDLPDDMRDCAEPTSFKAAKSRVVEQFERMYVERMLSRSAGNITIAAEAAAKNRRSFWQLMRKHRIDADRFRTGAESYAP